MPGPVFYDPKTGEAAPLSPEETQKAFSAGKLAPLKGQEVHVRTQDGVSGKVVGAENLRRLLSEGASIIDPDAEKHAKEVDAQRGIGGSAAAVGLGLVNGAAGNAGLGLIRQGIKQFSPEAGDKFQHTVENIQEGNPWLTMGSEAVGAVAMALAARGKGAGAAAARATPAAGIGALGRFAEGQAVKAGIKSTIGKMAVVGAAEGAAFGGLDEAGKEMLADHELSADKIGAASGFSLLGGTVLGGGLGAAGKLVGKLRGRAASKGARELIHGVADQAEAKAAEDVAAGIHLGPSAELHPEAYANPHQVRLRATDDLSVRPTENPFKFTKDAAGVSADLNAGLSEGVEGAPTMIEGTGDAPEKMSQDFRRRAVEAGMEGGGQAQTMGADPWLHEDLSPHADTDVFGLKKAYTPRLREGIEGLTPSRGENALGIETDKGVIAANEELRQGRTAPTTAEMPERVIRTNEEIRQSMKPAVEATEGEQLREVAKDFKGNSDSKAAKFAWADTKASKAETARVEAKRGGLESLWDTNKRRGVYDMGGESGGLVSGAKSLVNNNPEAILGRAETQLSLAMEELRSAQGAGVGQTTTVGEFLKPLDGLIKNFQKTGLTEEAAAHLNGKKNGMLRALGLVDPVTGEVVPGAYSAKLSFEQLLERRRQLQDLIYAHGSPDANLLGGAKEKLTFAWRNQEDAMLDKMAAGKGAEHKALNKDISNLIETRDAYKNRVIQLNQNNQYSLGDKFAGGLGAVFGHVGGTPGSIVSAMAMAQGNKIVRERGNIAAAITLDKLSSLGGIKSMLGQVDSAVDRAASSLAGNAAKTPKGPKVGKTASIGQRYRDVTKQMDEIQAKGPAHALESAKDLATHAPEVASSYSLAIARAAAYLASKRPESLSGVNPFDPKQEGSVLDTDKLKFIRTFDAVTNPMKALHDIEHGKVTPEAVDALKAVAPKLHEQLQKRTMEMLTQRYAEGNPVPFRKRLEIGLVLDIPADPSLEKGNFKALQANVSSPSDPVQPKARGGKSNAPQRPVKFSNPDAGYLNESRRSGRHI